MPGSKNYSLFNYKVVHSITTLALCFAGIANAQTPLAPYTSQWEQSTVSKITIIGNKTVTAEAILNLMTIKVGSRLTNAIVTNDIKNIFGSSYFQDVKFDKGDNNELIVSVVEKPTINNIIYEGFEIVSESSFKDKILTKKYNIVDEKKLSQDLRTIEQAYSEKGYYLAKPTYILEQTEQGVVNVIFEVKENKPIQIRRVDLLGNEYFSDAELQAFMATRPYSWLSILNSSGLYKDEYIAADKQNITFYYRDNGYAEATVASPLTRLDLNKKDIGVSFFIEEGERFNIGKITIDGDLIETEQEIKEKLFLQEGSIYRISKFNNDMQNLKVIYGDKGYAFAYIYPTFNIDREKKIYDIHYNITKGEKAYFRKITIEGNVKTRDNVIRRALKISEGQLFNLTKLDKSKANIERLGFFETVQLIPDNDKPNNVVDVRVIIKEKPTGRISASLGASPDVSGSGVSIFGQLQYQEPNLLGKAYNVGVTAQLSQNPQNSSDPNYSIGVNFGNPSIYDSPWSFGVNANYSHNVSAITSSSALNKAYLTQVTKSAGVSIGREVFIENLRFSLGYSLSDTSTDPSVPLTSKFYASGATEKVSQTLTYDATDNYINPTSGIYLSAYNAFGVKGYKGEYSFGTSSAMASFYIPLNYSDSFKTNFRIAFQPRFVYQLTSNQPVPIWERLSLGNSYYMKGYSNPGEALTPTVPVAISPLTGQTVNFPFGGNRSFYSTIEYFIPIIPQAGLRFVTFGEAGMVLDDYDTFTYDKLKYDIGFGFRWTTPIAPFRFEWAFPVDHQGNMGQAHFIFTIGSDSFNSNM
ncbi:outer membrane protein assembly factor BamA [Silvanigrella aquatica]|uniref:Outer membrane protein assembly factor BamA n=1 Tax=Silvanigrella aquatica TaxID=1915309 RepID=A0A1L4D3R6_9BACT|nr:outer membrane protein assembly factor BamA [Silvanigrella aquatica]APJ04829.1 outer membrane protein assembly factor BamA [Silvanigrella aquatica]